MALAALYGVGSGALHAVTGPDHVLSLGPAALSQPGRSFAIGLRWGVGHGMGTLLLSLVFLFATQWLRLEWVAAWGERLSALTLLALGVWSYRATHLQAASLAAHETRSPLYIGLVHGLGGAGSLLLMLPVLASGSLVNSLLFLLAFAVGSTLAMAAFTAALAKLGTRLARSWLLPVQRSLCCVSIAVGSYLLLAS